MTFSWLLPILSYPTATPTEGLSSAIAFAGARGGRLTAIAHVADIAPITNPLAAGFYDYGSVAAMVEADSQKAASSLAQLAQRLAAETPMPSTAHTIRSRPEYAAEDYATAARHHDFTLMVLDKDSNAHREAAEILLFGSGGPVVLFPGHSTPARTDKIAIAWDGGRAAARAVRDALPLLRLARHAVILTAGDDKTVAAGSTAAIAEFLAAHEVDVTHREVHASGKPVGEALQESAMDSNATLLVMGGYGHNRLREFVLGGATRSVLANLRLPVLMSH